MKMKCHVLEATDAGDKLRLKLQGYGVSECDNARWAPQLLEVPNNARIRRTFYVGRHVTIEIKPEGK